MDESHNSNTASGDYTVGPFVSRMKQNVGDFCGYCQPPVPSGNAGFVSPPRFKKRSTDPEFHLKAHFYLDEEASAEDWLDWASAVG